MNRLYLWSALLAILTTSLAGTLRAQEPEPAVLDSVETFSNDDLEAPSDTLATVMLAGKKLFAVGAQSVTGAQDRADAIGEEILRIAQSYRRRPEDLRAVSDERINAILLMSSNQYIAAVWDYEAAAHGVNTEELAEQRLEIIREAIIEYRSDFSARSILKGVLFAVGSTLIFVIVLIMIGRLHRRLDTVVETRVGGRTLFKILSGESLISFTHGISRLLRFVTVTWITLVFLNFLLSLFPWTYGFAAQLFELAVGPLRAFGTALLAQVPSLFFLAFIIAGNVFLLRGIGFFFNEIERERISIRGFYPDWARPTFNIVRLITIAFAIVVAFPYIPGSESDAFKGMSLFLGLLVSLGSGSAMANVISGIFLIYMRPFEIGDRVRIGETVGDVVDRNLLTTRLRTMKNERVTIPNTNILSGQIRNYTSKRRRRSLILHTSVTIGYDVPWRTVHELLIAAAMETEHVIPEPGPFVLQKGLHDFYVEYELNAHTDEPRVFPATYSQLHQNIQDRFNEANVEILSPHYRFMRPNESEETN